MKYIVLLTLISICPPAFAGEHSAAAAAAPVRPSTMAEGKAAADEKAASAALHGLPPARKTAQEMFEDAVKKMGSDPDNEPVEALLEAIQLGAHPTPQSLQVATLAVAPRCLAVLFDIGITSFGSNWIKKCPIDDAIHGLEIDPTNKKLRIMAKLMLHANCHMEKSSDDTESSEANNKLFDAVFNEYLAERNAEEDQLKQDDAIRTASLISVLAPHGGPLKVLIPQIISPYARSFRCLAYVDAALARPH